MSSMAAAAARVAVRVKRWPVNIGGFENDEDTYSRLTAKFPAEPDRILDDVLGKLMLDGWVPTTTTYQKFVKSLDSNFHLHFAERGTIGG